jgi:predicted ArsR family transcriptional regulator
MTRMIKDYVEIGDHASLDSLIARLIEVRDSLPAEAETEVKMRGDDIFGRHLCIGFLRPLTAEEAACEGRYSDRAKTRLKRAA